MRPATSRLMVLIVGILCSKLSAQPSSCGPILNTGSNHTILLANFGPTLNGSALPLGSHIIVLFDDAGALGCAGAIRWLGVNTALAAYGNDAFTPEKDGFAEGESFRYRVELPNGAVYEDDCIAVQYAMGGIFSQSGNFTVNGISGLTAFAVDTVLCAFQCPVLGMNIGDSCDDLNPTTVNDTVSADCICAGTATALSIRPFVVANAGAYQSVSNFSLTWTLGQIAGETLDTLVGTVECYWLRQGFQQPFEWLLPEPAIACIVSTYELPAEKIVVQVFPNPFSGVVRVIFEKPFPHSLEVSALDGRMVFAQHSDAWEDQADLGFLGAGMYLLFISDPQTGEKKACKVVKH